MRAFLRSLLRRVTSGEKTAGTSKVPRAFAPVDVKDMIDTHAGGGGLVDATETLHTSSPNDTVNAWQLKVTGGTTNTDMVLTPRGNAALIGGPQPDGTNTGGVKRGQYAVDLCMAPRPSYNTYVASGSSSFQAGYNNLTSGPSCGTIGEYNSNSGNQGAFTAGYGNSNSGKQGMVLGGNSVLSGEYNTSIGYYNNMSATAGAFQAGYNSETTASYATTLGPVAKGDRVACMVLGGKVFAARGDSQSLWGVLSCKTTTNSAVEMFLEGSNRLTVPSGKVIGGLIIINGQKSDGSAVAHYIRQFCLKNVSGTTSEVFSPVTIGTDNAAGTSISITADDTNDALKIEATGVTSENWCWQAVVWTGDLKYG